MSAAISPEKSQDVTFVNYETNPRAYRHWRLQCDGAIATLTLDVQEDAGIRPGYKLKLNSYDLGVDIELHDALQRIRFEHPEVRSVVITSAKPRVFCSGANIYMLGLSTHAWKVNFCKFTNETRNGIEDSSRHSGLKFIAACNGSTAGGGYELALACDEIVLIDDRSSAVSLPEIPLLGVLPGTGGLTRLIDKRKVRRDRADVFCTTSEGLQGQRARDWGFVDHVAKPQQFSDFFRRRAEDLAALSDRPSDAKGVELTPLHRTVDDAGYHYQFVDVALDRKAGTATFTIRAPEASEATLDEILAAGARWWPLQMSRELDDAILSLRTNELELGLWIFKTSGSVENVLAIDRQMIEHRSHWFVRETLGMLRRTLARLEVSSRSIFAVIEPGSCFAGSLLEIALAADRVYMLDDPANAVALSELNFGALSTVNHRSRVEARLHGSTDALRARIGERFSAREALDAGLVTFAPDDLDWADELRQAIEARAALSPDALTGMESNLRFGLPETMETRIFGRLSAWQNWIFSRPNAVGPEGALKVYGGGARPKFDKERV
ncbi:MAG TPA: 2,3-epoxybenzoyl-CoA dihydrolase [Bryobacteraceae bacterium]|nr:2,3-epoxybenzoyl-CoA dihydrolase [Bryobacteraceae bacterium]